MRLRAVNLKRYRIHRDTTIEFAPGLTLIAGPNESGKSTLVEAVHRALFMRHKAGGEILQAMRSSVWGEPPEVTLTFETGADQAQTVTVAKRFRGQSGTCTLQSSGAPPANGDDAEQRLAEILGVGEPIGRAGAETLARRWAHLWVWQGTSGQPPLEAVTEHQEALIKRLQSLGGAALMQSDLDTRVLKAIRERREQWLTAAGRPKAQSDLAIAEAEVEALRADLALKQGALRAVAEAAAAYEAVELAIPQGEAAVAESAAELAQAEQRRQTAEQLARDLEPLAGRRREIDTEIASLQKVAANRVATRQRLDEARSALATCEQRAARLRAEHDADRKVGESLDAALEQARGRTRAAGAWQTALFHHQAVHDQEAQVERLRAAAEAIRQKRLEMTTLQDETMQVPKVEDKHLKTLNKLQQEATSAAAALEALGARVEVIRSRDPVHVGGRTLAIGAVEIITADTEFEIGIDTRLRVCPGGHTSLQAAREELAVRERKLAEKLEELGVASPDEAVTAAERHKALKARLAQLHLDLEGLNAETNETELLAARQRLEDATRRAAMAAETAGRPLPNDPALIRDLLQRGEQELRAAEQQEKAAQSACAEARRKLDRVATELAGADGEAQKVRKQMHDEEARLRALEELHGTDEDRERRLAELTVAQGTVAAQAAAIERQIAALQPDQLESDLRRLRQALKNAQEGLAKARQDQAVLQERLRSHGLHDPEREQIEAMVRLEQAEARHRQLRQQADAIKHLADVAEAAQDEAARQFVQPLARVAGEYLACVFGPGAGVNLDWSPGGQRFGELTITRETSGRIPFNFSALSGGTCEQLGVAMRLAMAEVMAASHDGCLPIVLDDAFANSDPERISMIQRMLYRAADRGLQVIVLACNPRDYEKLGATVVHLPRPDWSVAQVPTGPAGAGSRTMTGAALAEPTSTDRSPEPTETGSEEPPRTTDDEERLLRALGEKGGSAGNLALQDLLGWEKPRYDQVKDRLLRAGRLEPGRGRGGSVRLPGTGTGD